MPEGKKMVDMYMGGNGGGSPEFMTFQDVKPGERIFIDRLDSVDENMDQRLRQVATYPPEHRGGFVLSVEQLDMTSSVIFVIIDATVDFPISYAAHQYSSQLRMPDVLCAHLVAILSTDIRRRVFLRRGRVTNPGAYVCCSNINCRKVDRAGTFVRFCNTGHFVCANHFISQDQAIHDFYEIQIITASSEASVKLPCMEARILYCCFMSDRMGGGFMDSSLLITQTSKYDDFPCTYCKYAHQSGLVNVRDLERQLVDFQLIAAPRKDLFLETPNPRRSLRAMESSPLPPSSVDSPRTSFSRRNSSSRYATPEANRRPSSAEPQGPAMHSPKVHIPAAIARLEQLEIVRSLPDRIRIMLLRNAEVMMTQGRSVEDIEAVILEQTATDLQSMDLDLFVDLTRLKESQSQKSRPQSVRQDRTYSRSFSGANMRLFIERPDQYRRGKFEITVNTDASYDEVLEIACEAVGCTEDVQDLMLIKVEESGWNRKIEYEDVPSDATGLWGIFRDGDVAQVRRIKTAFVGGRYPLSTIANHDRFNQSIQRKIQEMGQTYEGFLEIRGDGNCYYRAILYGLLEQAIVRQDRVQCFQDLHNVMKTITFEANEDARAQDHHRLLSILQAAADNQRWLSVKELECDILDESTGLDSALIVASKKLVMAFLKDNKETEWNGLSMQIAIMSTHEQYKDFDEYCDDQVMKMGECAEGPHVDIGILPMLLNAYAEIVMLDRNEHVPLIKKGGWEEGMEPRRYQVSLLFRPGHYDLLYRQQFVSAVAALEPAMAVTPTSRPSTPSDALPPGSLLRRHSRSTDGESYDRTSPAPAASAAAAGLPRAPSPHLLAPNSPALGAVAGGTPSRTGSIAGGIVGVAVTPLSLPAAASATTVAVTNANGTTTASDSGGIAATTSVSGSSVRERDFARALAEAQKKDSTLKLPKMVERAQMLVDMELHIPFIFEAWFTHKPKNENEWLTNYFMVEEAHGGVPVNEILSSSSAANDNDNDDANNNKTANGSDASVVSTAPTTATAATAARPKAPATKDKLEGLSEDDRRLVKEYEGRMTPYQRNHAMEAIVHVRLHTKFPMPLILHAVVTKGVIEKAALIRACDEAWRKEREEQAKQQQQQQQQPSPPLPPSAEVSDATVVKPPLPPSLPSTATATPLSLASGVDPEEQGWLRKVEEAAPTFIKEKAKTNVKLMLRDGDFPPALILEAVVVGKQYTCAGIQQYCETAEANAAARTAPAPPAAPAAAVSVLPPPPPPTATEERRTSSVTQQQQQQKQQASGTTETAKFSAQYASESTDIVKPVAQHQTASSLPPSTQQQPQSQQQAPTQPRVPTPPFLPPLDEELPAIDPTDTILEQGNLTASEEKKIMHIRAKVPVDQWTAALRELVAVYVAGPFDLDLVLDAVVTGQCYAAAEIRVFCHNATEAEKANKQRRLQSLRVDVAAPVEAPAAMLTPPVPQPSPSSSSGHNGVRATLPPQTVRTVIDADSYSSTSNGGGGSAAKASPKSLAQRYSEISQSMKAPLSPPPPSSQTSSSSSFSPNAAPLHSAGSKAATDTDQVPPTTNPMLLKRAASGLPSPHTSAAPSPRTASPVVRAASSPALQQPPLPPVSSTPKRLSRHELCEISDKFHFSRLYQQYERLVDVFHFANDHAIAAIVTFSCFNLRAAIRCIRFSERHEILRKSTLMPIGDDDADDAVVVAVYQQGRAQGIERGMLLDAIGYEHVTQVAEVNEAYARYVSRSDTVTSSHNSSTNSLQNLVQKASAPTPASPLASPLATAAATAAAAAAAPTAVAPLAAATSPMSGGIASLAHNRSAMRPRPTPLQPELVGNNLQASPLRSRSNAPSTTPTPTSSSAAAPPTPSQMTPSARGATTAAAAPVPAPVSASTTPTTQPRPIVIGSRPSLSRTPSSAAATPVATPTSTPSAAGRRASTGATATASGSSKVTRTESPHKRTVSIAIVGSRPGKITTASTGLPATANAAAAATTANEAATTTVTASGSTKTPAVATTGSSKLTPTATLRRSSTATRPTSTATTPTATTTAVPTTPGASSAAASATTPTAVSASTTPTTGSSSRMLRVPFEEERDDIWKRLKEDKLKTLDRVQAQDWLKYHGLWDERSMRAKSVIDLRDILVKFKRTPKSVARTTATGGAAATTPTTTTTRR